MPIKTAKGFERQSWEQTWMNLAFDVAKRSACVKAQCGAVIVTPDNRIIGSGYNGPPSGFTTTCAESCPRALNNENDSTYESCISIHAEANAVMHTPRADRMGGTIYVSTCVCILCAKLIANSGLKAVVMRVKAGDAHRQPDRTVAFLQASGLDVRVWGVGIPTHRVVFFETYGAGPHHCHFCSDLLPWVEVVHHLDLDHSNNAPDNLAPAHHACHSSYHNKGKEISEEMRQKLRKPRVMRKFTCQTCGFTSTNGRVYRHCFDLNHLLPEKLENYVSRG